MTMVQHMMSSLVVVDNLFYPFAWHDNDNTTLPTWTSSSGDGMSTACCLTMPNHQSSLISPHYRQEKDDDIEGNYSIISNPHLPFSMNQNNLTLPNRSSHQQLLLVAEEAEPSEIDNLNDNDKLLLPRSTRSLKRRTSLFEKSRDWARRLMTLHRTRRNTTSNERIREACSEINNRKLSRISSHPKPLSQKSFDEDGYLSPLEIKANLDNITRENNDIRQQHHQSLSKLSNNPEQLLLYSHSSSDVSQLVYRCQGALNQSIPPSQCTCQPPPPTRIPTTSFASEFHKSLSIVDYIDFDVADESTRPDDDDPLDGLRFLFDTDKQQQQQQSQQTNSSSSRRTPRRSTNTSSISTDSGYCDMPVNSSSTKLIPVHLISCTLIPVNVATVDTLDRRCVTCTCSSGSCSYTTTTMDRRRKKSSSSSSSSYPHHILMRTSTHMDVIENGMVHNRCSCNSKYYSTMTICPTLPLPSVSTPIDEKNEECYYKQRRHTKKKRASLIRFPSVTDDLASIARWYKPHLQRETVCDALQQADYGAFLLRNSSTHPECYALSLKVPRFTHESNIAHYLIEKCRQTNDNSGFRIKGTMKQFPTLLSLITHHSVMPEILPITLNLSASIAV